MVEALRRVLALETSRVQGSGFRVQVRVKGLGIQSQKQPDSRQAGALCKKPQSQLACFGLWVTGALKKLPKINSLIKAA